MNNYFHIKMNYSKSYFRLLVSILLLQIILSDKLSEQIEPICTKNKLNILY